MTFLIAAAGTGGHVFPGLSVGEALVDLGVPDDDIVFVGGDRLEATVYPSEGYRFVQVELAGLKRSFAFGNARLPGVMLRARRRIADEIGVLGVEVVLGMGGYVTIPAALAARKRRVPFFNAEQNAVAGLANKLTARWAQVSFVAFPQTGGLPQGTWVGNPVRRAFWSFDRESLRPEALQRYELTPESPVVGVFGGSLGAGSINEAVAAMAARWVGPDVQVIHLTGATQSAALEPRSAADSVTWRRREFEDRMDLFFAASDLVISRSGGAVAELTATGTPSILVPGQFGSGGHQEANARFLAESGTAVVLGEDELDRLSGVVADLISHPEKRADMAAAAHTIAKPDAAHTIARTMIEAATSR
jgi:UDP-N-acetylglucosamine--N-acetylmuramyl-(pentapeptide) pyrophosphoryl-undecaprenol N-acetylglucosamine transferase